VQRDVKKPPPDGAEQAAALLKGVDPWAASEKQRQGVVENAAVVGLDPKQAASIKNAAAKLAAYIPTIRKAVQQLDPALDSLQQAAKLAAQAKTSYQSSDPISKMEAVPFVTQGRELVVKAGKQVQQITGGIDTAIVQQNLTVIASAMTHPSSMTVVIKNLNTTMTEARKVQDAAKSKADSAQRIEILLRSFLALNDPGMKGAPSAAEINSVKGMLAGGLGDEFVAVLGTAVDYELLSEFANTLGHQIEAREMMTKATGKPAPAIPGQGDAYEFFTALAKKDNDEVFAAYESFANAFFYHRQIASVGELSLTANDLFAPKASITGKRGMVCTGYATVGAEMLSRAGATVNGFSVGIHASDDMVRNDQLEESGHAVAQLSRKGKSVCVSNERILPTKNALVGSGAIQWGNPKNPLFVGVGATMAAAVKDMMKKVQKRKDQLAAPAGRK
jgi:hypothetical protein